MNCVLIDTVSSGHHVTYMAAFSDSVLACGIQPHVVFPIPDAVREQMNRTGTDPDKATFHVCTEEDFAQPLQGFAARVRLVKRWRDAARAVQGVQQATGVPVDCVFFAWMDPLLVDLPTTVLVNCIFRHRFSGLLFAPFRILMNPHPGRPGLRWVRSREHALRLKKCLSMCVLDETLKDKLAEKVKKETVLLPDFADNSLPADVELRRIRAEIRFRSKDRIVLGVLGSLESRKGVIDVLRLIEGGTAPQLFLVMAGEVQWHSFTEPERQLLKRIQERGLGGSYIRFGRLPHETELNALLSACDVLFLCYRDFRQSSNFLGKAAHFRVPVVAFDEHLIGWRVKRHKLGWTVSAEGREAFLQTLDRQTINDLTASKEYLTGASAYEKEHDRGMLPGRLAKALGLRLRIPPAA
jgi:glycosyltransferase involved in cell wall biosynthesis